MAMASGRRMVLITEGRNLRKRGRYFGSGYTPDVNAIAERITVDPAQCGGRPCIRGMRIRVSDVLDLLAAGLSAEQVIEELPDLEAADVEACLRFASR